MQTDYPRISRFFPGIFSEYFVAHQEDIFKAPEHLTDAEAAALPLAGLTAYRAVFTKGQVSKGHNVLITGIGNPFFFASILLRDRLLRHPRMTNGFSKNLRPLTLLLN